MQSPEQLREHFEIERALAARLRDATDRSERRALYAEVYRERSELIPHHPLVAQAGDASAREIAVAPQVRLLSRFIDRDSSFCELGAGDGAVARALGPRVRSAVALDVTDVLALPDDDAAHFSFSLFDGFEIPLAPGSIDFAYSNDVVEHLHPDDVRDHARAVLDVLRPGGAYLCVTPNRLSGPHDVSRHFSETAEGFHLHEYTVTELARLFREVGFSRAQILLSVGGRHLSPRLPAAAVAWVEAPLAALPRAPRRPLATGLAAVKVVAVK
jgi:SAM-dependent methyltransferase